MGRNYNTTNKRGRVRNYYAPRRSSNRDPDLRRMPVRISAEPQELLTGYVNGLAASDIEERFAKALDYFGKNYSFQVDVPTFGAVPGEWRSVDFMVQDAGQYFPVEIYGEISHTGSDQKARDSQREALLNREFMRLQGVKPLSVVWYYDLVDEQTSRNTVSRLWLV